MINGENTVFQLVRCKSDEEWLEQRTKGIGGSDVAAIMGLSPWKTPLDVWLEKTGRKQADDLSAKPYVQFGVEFENTIGEHYKREHPAMQVRRVNAICRSIERPWAQASLDYEVKDYASGTWGVLEIKTARSAKDWGDTTLGNEGVPVYYLTQVLHYLQVTGREYAHLCVFFRDTCEYRTYLITPDENDMAAIRKAVDRFWKDFVDADKMPAVSGSDVARLAQLYADDNGETAAADDPLEFDKLAQAYREACDAEKSARAKKSAIAAQLASEIKENKAVEGTVYRVTAIRSKYERTDLKALKAAYPEVYALYTTTEFRNGGLRIKELT